MKNKINSPQRNNKNNKNKNQKVKMYISPLLPKRQPRSSFKQRMLTVDSSQIKKDAEGAFDLKFSPDVTEGWKFPVQMILGPISKVTTDDVIKYVKKNNQEIAGSRMCAQHYLLRISNEGQALVMI